jgi:large conductance mechanosensitive channel
MLKGFRDFIARGNVVELAVAVIIGAAFGGVVDSLSKDIITPIITSLGGQPDFSTLKLGPLGIGNFLNAVINFIIKAAAIYFIVVKTIGKLAARLAAATPLTRSETLLAEIRDLLAKRPA